MKRRASLQSHSVTNWAKRRSGGASDGNFVAALGIPVLDGLGVTGDGAHTLYEHILVSDIANRAALLTCLLMEAE